MRKTLSVLLMAALLISCITVVLAEGDSWVCAECSRENKASYQFCPGCGAARSQTCGSCGYEFQEDELDFAFCPQCGSSLTEPSAQTEPPQTVVNDQPCLITKDEASVFYICDLPWDSDVITAVSTLESAVNMSAYADGTTHSATLYPNAEIGLFPGLTSNCYMPLMNVYPAHTDDWWLECQIAPDHLTFDSAHEAAEWFSGVWSKLKTALDLPEPSGIQVSYPESFTGEQTVRDTDPPEEMLRNWAEAIDRGIDGITIQVWYSNMAICLEHAMDADGSEHIISWIILQPPEKPE